MRIALVTASIVLTLCAGMSAGGARDRVGFAGGTVTPSEAAGTRGHPVLADEAATAWAAATGTTSQAVLEDFIRRYPDSFYATLARARLDDLRRAAMVPAAAPLDHPSAPPPSPEPPPPLKPAIQMTRAELTQLFGPFRKAIEQVRLNYVDKPEDPALIRSAVQAMVKKYPTTKPYSIAGEPLAGAEGQHDYGKADMNAFYNVAAAILEGGELEGSAKPLVGTAINGMLAGLDSHSNYLDPKSLTDTQTQNRGTFGGLGVEVTMSDGLVKVVAPYDDTPAARAGLRAGDLITQIDGATVQGLTLNEAVDKMRGPVNTRVRLRIERQGSDTPIEQTITRETVRVQTVRMRVEDGSMGYIRIISYNAQTADAVKKAIADIGSQVRGPGLKGYVLDLRNSPGGLLDQAIAVADMFLERGEILSTRGRIAKQNQHFAAKPGDLASGKRIVVLINGGSAGVGEIVAGALQDQKRAALVGTRSAGQGSIQTLIQLGGDDGAIRLTTSRQFTPLGHPIQGSGISPDLEVLQTVPEDNKQNAGGDDRLQSYIPPNAADDRALATAFDLLRGNQPWPKR